MKTLEQIVGQHRDEWAERSRAQQQLEIENNEAVAKLYGLEDEVPSHVPLERVSLTNNSAFRWPNKSPEERDALFAEASIIDLISYAVGCMFGRYSLDKPGLILGDQGSTLQEYLAEVPSPSFMPDEDNVLPVVDGDWFEDDIVAKLRQFLRVTFGEENFEENLRYIEETLGVKTLRDYFMTRGGRSRFYEDHVKRYKKRPIYWMFSSPRGSFNALIYMHRYTPATVSTVLNEYLREYSSKLEATVQNLEREANSAGSPRERALATKEAERLRKTLVELAEYEHDVMYPLAARQLEIDLDDGVLVNYLRFGKSLKNFGLERQRKKVESWDWPKHSLEPGDA